MADPEQIRQAIEKCCDWLANEQKPDGSWSLGKYSTEHVPPPYQKDIVLTSQCLQALVYSQNPKYLKNIERALNFCINYKCEEEGDIESWAWKLLALNFSNTLISQKAGFEILTYLKRKQKSNGAWPFSMSDHSITNYSVILASQSHEFPGERELAAAWFMNARSKNGGWSEISESTAASPGNSGVCIISLLMLGKNPADEYFAKSTEFIKSTQESDGSWGGSKPEGKGIWPTCMCAEALMRSLETPFSSEIEAAIGFILSGQAYEGYFPRTIKSPTRTYFTAFYVVRLLQLYAYLKEKLASRDAEKLRKYLKDSRHLVAYYCDKFEEDILTGFKLNTLSAIVNARALGATPKAIGRRRDILGALWARGESEVADIIDFLREDSKYQYLNKKAHMTQIKADVEYLRALGLIQKQEQRYFAVVTTRLPL